jgi:hypothetical protein
MTNAHHAITRDSERTCHTVNGGNCLQHPIRSCGLSREGGRPKQEHRKRSKQPTGLRNCQLRSDVLPPSERLFSPSALDGLSYSSLSAEPQAKTVESAIWLISGGSSLGAVSQGYLDFQDSSKRKRSRFGHLTPQYVRVR